MKPDPSPAAPERATRVREAFAALLGAEAVEAVSRRWKVPSAEPPPAAVLMPRDEEQVAACLRLACERGWRVLPAGSGTWLAAGNPLAGVDAVLSVARLDRIVQYEPADLTLTAGAGLSLGELDRQVATEGQWLPLDPPGPDQGSHQGSLGGTLATASAGGLALSYGQPRDLVLGLRLVTGDGRRLGLGGRVVKNVAGFDLVKLAVGSWGSLGVITEASLRLYPRPAGQLTLVARAARLEDLMDGARAVRTAPLAPAAAELIERPLEGGAAGGREAALVVRLVGIQERVEKEAELLERRLAPLTVERVHGQGGLGGPGGRGGQRGPDQGDGASLAGAVRTIETDCELALRFALPAAELSDLVQLARAVGRLRPGHDELADAPYRVAADALRGALTLAVARVRVDPPWAQAWADRLAELRRTVEMRGGSLTICHGPAEVVAAAGAWGDAGGATRLMAGLKRQFDPGGILSPGRWVP